MPEKAAMLANTTSAEAAAINGRLLLGGVGSRLASRERGQDVEEDEFRSNVALMN